MGQRYRHRQLKADELEKRISNLERVKQASVYNLVDHNALQEIIDDYQNRYKAQTGHHFHYHAPLRLAERMDRLKEGKRNN